MAKNVQALESSLVPSGVLPQVSQKMLEIPEMLDVKKAVKILSFLSHKNIILDASLNGQIQIIGAKSVAYEEAYELVLAALKGMGFTLVETSSAMKIVPVKQAQPYGLEIYSEQGKAMPRTEQFIIKIFKIENIKAEDLKKILTRVYSGEALYVFESSNLLLAIGTGFDLRRLAELVAFLDAKDMDDNKLKQISIVYRPSQEVFEKLNEIATDLLTPKEKLQTKFLNDVKSNAIYFFGSSAVFEKIKKFVHDYDLSAAKNDVKSNFRMHPLFYAQAKNIASTLTALASGERRRVQSNRVEEDAVSQGAGANPASPAGGDSFSTVGSLKILSDEASNSLLLTGSPSELRSAEPIIRRLDRKKDLVFIEVEILELNGSLAVEWDPSFLLGLSGRSQTVVGWQAGRGAQGLSTAGGDASGSGGLAALKDDWIMGVLSGNSVKIKGLGTVNPSALVRVVKNDKGTRNISSPYLLTLDNEDAEITVGDSFYYSNQGGIDASGLYQKEYQKENVDLNLNIHTHITGSESLNLKIKGESQSVTGLTENSTPIINKKKFTQVVILKNGQTTLLSGFRQISRNVSENKVPLLAEIPFLGWLFRSLVKEDSESRLLVFITPHILYGDKDVMALYEKKVGVKP